MAAFFHSALFLLILRKSELVSAASTLSISSTSVPPVELQQDHKPSGGSANNDNSNWLLILLVCFLSVAAVAAVVQLFCCCCNKKGKRKYPEHDDERNVLLDEPEHIDIVEKKQQPRPVSIESREDFFKGVLVPVKQQLEADKAFAPDESENYRGLPKGLVNIGNTCYFNAMLQCLNHTYMLGPSLYAPQQCGKLTAAFKEFLNLMQCEKMPCIVPNYLHSVFCETEQRFADGSQHDSHECLRHFLDVLRREERAISSTAARDETGSSLTLVDKLFGGHFMTVYVCCACKEPYHVCEPFLDINLPIRLTDEARSHDSAENLNVLYLADNGDKTDSDEVTTDDSLYREAAKLVVTPLNCQSVDSLQRSLQHPSVEDCLRYFTRPEFISGGYLCHSCTKLADPQDHSGSTAQLTSAVKRTLILDPPAILTLHLKRFEQNPSGFTKYNTKISYEELLDISPYSSLWCMRNERKEENIWYALYAVVLHIGSTLKSGHYVAYVKVRDDNERNLERFVQKSYFDRKVSVDQLVEMMKLWKMAEGRKSTPWKAKVQSGTWYRMCDSDIFPVKATDALNQDAYLLFYERLDSEAA